MTRDLRRMSRLALVTMLAGTVAACGEDPQDDIQLVASSQWIEYPGSVAEFGYQILADVGWVDRVGTCARLPPGLRVTVNGREAHQIFSAGACSFDALFAAGPFNEPGPVTIRALDGDRRIGEATFDGLFRGLTATLLAPDGGVVHQDEQVTFSIAPGPSPRLAYARFYWLETAPSVPPFYTYASVELSLDAASATVPVPAVAGLLGRAALVLEHIATEPVAPSSLSGFATAILTDSLVTGPLYLDILPPLAAGSTGSL